MLWFALGVFVGCVVGFVLGVAGAYFALRM